MESNSNATGGPNLSQYFANDPPSFFDQIPKNQQGKKQGNITHFSAINYDATFRPVEYLETAEHVETKVSDAVKNFWEPPYGELGIPPLLTMPAVSTQNDMSDPIREVVFLHLGEEELSHRKILSVDSVTQDERGLRSLIAAGCLRSAINLTGRLLTIYGQGYGRSGAPAKHSPHSLQLWFTRLALLAKLGQTEMLLTESEFFDQLNRPDVYFEFYPEMYSGKKGSMACFSFRLLLAEIPLCNGRPKVALDRLSELHSICKAIKNYFIDDKSAYEFWRHREIRVLHSIVNCCVLMREYSLIDEVFLMLLKQDGIQKEEKRTLFSAWGRIYLQIGDIFGAEQNFSEARRLKGMSSSLPDFRDFVDKGLISVAKNDFQEAFLLFQKALQLDSGNSIVLNNMGVCLLYGGKLKDAIHLFENAIDLNPQKSLNESLLINLSTLYELESSNSKAKKLNLLKLVNRFKPDLNVSLEFCLKLQSSN